MHRGSTCADRFFLVVAGGALVVLVFHPSVRQVVLSENCRRTRHHLSLAVDIIATIHLLLEPNSSFGSGDGTGYPRAQEMRNVSVENSREQGPSTQYDNDPVLCNSYWNPSAIHALLFRVADQLTAIVTIHERGRQPLCLCLTAGGSR
jgi:hypothetical protein